jgi:hypothetical protein
MEDTGKNETEPHAASGKANDGGQKHPKFFPNPIRWFRSLSDAEKIQAMILVVTLVYVGSSISQCRLMSQSFEISERAVIAFKIRELAPMSRDQPMTFTIYIENIGHNVATNVTPVVNRDFQPKGVESEFPMPRTYEREQPVAPGSERAWPVTLDVLAEELKKERVERIDDGRENLYVYGIVRYNNGFRLDCAAFCYRFKPPIGAPTVVVCERPPIERCKEALWNSAILFERTPSSDGR